MVSLFLDGDDQYLIMFKDSNIFEFTNFLSKQSIIILKFILLIAIIYCLGENKKKQLLKQFFDQIYCVFINIPSKLDDFWRES